ncbi:hypothetical protein KC345_g1744 [Hortaea werneckii]|nr:hypothetical protein KC345_g1744 [Hortaea werneckii]
MDDLLGEDWQQPPPKQQTKTAALNPSPFASAYSSFRASPQPPQSGAVSPQSFSRPASTAPAPPKPAGDAFGNILGVKSQKAGNNLTLQERQQQVEEEKRKESQQQAQLWDNLGSGRGTPEVRQPSPAVAQETPEEDDILAAFHKDAPVDKSSHHPPPPGRDSTAPSGRATPATAVGSHVRGTGAFEGEDDDPFGLSAAPVKTGNGHAVAPAAPQSNTDTDDILGDLGKPVPERPPPQRTTSHAADQAEEMFEQMQNRGEAREEPQDRALAELVEMGFPADTAKIALTETNGDTQDAVGWLLRQAHEESKQQAREEGQEYGRRAVPSNRSSSRQQQGSRDNSIPAWARQEGRPSSASRRQDTGSPANGDKDASQMASEFGNKLFKGANSLWKASQKQMAKTMADFQQERDSSQPKWMQEPSAADGRAGEQRRQRAARDVTDEAAMLDAPREPRPAKPARPMPSEQSTNSPARGHSPADALPHRPASQPKFLQQQQEKPSGKDKRPATKLSRQEVEDQTAQAYVSPARRKRPTPKPEPSPQPEPEVDLFSPAPAQKPSQSPVPAQNSASSRPSPAPRPSPAAVRPKAPPRDVPSVSPAALSSSAQHRKAGGEAFKRGDFDAAHQLYTAAITPLPGSHPIMIVVLSNRALTALKTGDPKTAVSDADRVLEIIGIGQGAGESINLGSGEGSKDMKEFYGKALMRKAEALEHMEKYSDAVLVWKQAVETGVGGAVSIRGRDRCEKAANPDKPAAAPARSKAPPPRKAPASKPAASRPTVSSSESAEAVKKLRAANAAAEKADDEKFALTDQVEARIDAWRGGKADNLRALLQSLDGVLWEGAGWKKVGMSDLVMPNKVKIVYMKAIGKVHPDKIPQDATVEQKMVSAAVFSTLNEAWDKFKKDNNL